MEAGSKCHMCDNEAVIQVYNKGSDVPFEVCLYCFEFRAVKVIAEHMKQVLELKGKDTE